MRRQELEDRITEIHKLCSESNEQIKNAVGSLRNDVIEAGCIHDGYCDCDRDLA